MKQAVDLYTMLSITGVIKNENNLVYLRKDYEHELPGNPSEIWTVKDIRHKYDMRRTKVVSVTPYFRNHEYEGLLFTVRDGMTRDEILEQIRKSSVNISGLQSFMMLYMDCVDYLHQVRINHRGAGRAPYIIRNMEQWFHSKGIYMIMDAVKNVSVYYRDEAEGFCRLYTYLLECTKADEDKLTELIDLIYNIPGQFIRDTKGGYDEQE